MTARDRNMRLALAAKDAALVTASGEHGDKDMTLTYLTAARR